MDAAKRIVCPMVDASRRTEAYGQKALPGTESSNLEQWADALGLTEEGVKMIAYFSDDWYDIPKNVLRGSFDDQEVNGGFIHQRKNGVHTGIYQQERFSQQGWNEFVWAIHPTLKGTSLSDEWLYSHQADALYMTTAHLSTIMAYNRAQSTEEQLGLGPQMSAFEMEDLLLGVLGQAVEIEAQSTQAILLRDVHDLYKYGFLTVPVEERLAAAGLLRLDE
jgi:hypothetical protein